MYRLALASLVTLLAVCVVAAPAAAEQGKIKIKAKTEPAELQPGGSFFQSVLRVIRDTVVGWQPPQTPQLRSILLMASSDAGDVPLATEAPDLDPDDDDGTQGGGANFG